MRIYSHSPLWICTVRGDGKNRITQNGNRNATVSFEAILNQSTYQCLECWAKIAFAITLIHWLGVSQICVVIYHLGSISIGNQALHQGECLHSSCFQNRNHVSEPKSCIPRMEWHSVLMLPTDDELLEFDKVAWARRWPVRRKENSSNCNRPGKIIARVFASHLHRRWNMEARRPSC
jgi:hypothetical protein